MRENPFLTIFDKTPCAAVQKRAGDCVKVEIFNRWGWPIASREFASDEREKIEAWIREFWR